MKMDEKASLKILDIKCVDELSISYLKKQFNNLALLVHPDKQQSSAAKQIPEIFANFNPADHFTVLVQAYELLLNKLLNKENIAQQNINSEVGANYINVLVPNDLISPDEIKLIETWQVIDLGSQICILCRCGSENYLNEFKYITTIDCMFCSYKYKLIYN